MPLLLSMDQTSAGISGQHSLTSPPGSLSGAALFAAQALQTDRKQVLHDILPGKAACSLGDGERSWLMAASHRRSGMLQGEGLPGAAVRVLHGQQGHARLDEQLGSFAPGHFNLLPEQINITCCLHLEGGRGCP